MKNIEFPIGRVTKRKIGGRIYYYHEYEIDGKRHSKTIKEEEYLSLKKQIEDRRKSKKEKVEAFSIPSSYQKGLSRPSYINIVLTGEELRQFINPVKEFKKRDCYKKIEEYLYSPNNGKVLILYGLRRTGKTTLAKQSILNMKEIDLAKTAFIQIKKGDTLANLNKDLSQLRQEGYKYIYIDEVTYLSDFIEGGELFSDIYAAMGMKIILSGTDSLGFYLSKGEHLYDRCLLLHTTYIPYHEIERVLNIKGIDEYISFGGNMSIEGNLYNSDLDNPIDEYLDTAIANNIQHSLSYYQDGGHFRELKELYDANELTSAINWVIEDMNHEFAQKAINEDFLSHDLGISARNLRKDKDNPIDILDKIDKSSFLARLKQSLSIVDPKDRKITLSKTHLEEIKEYLLLLDFIKEVDVISLPNMANNRKKVIVSQPAIRYIEAKKMVEALFLDPLFAEFSQKEISYIQERILNEVKGRMMEDIVLLESYLASKKEKVFKLEFPVGEFDMVKVFDNGESSEIYEIKHSLVSDKRQLVNLLDEEKCRLVENKFGKIRKKVVIYRGIDKEENGVSYLNVEGYLRGLGE